jgi:catechol 2,3-dioxygenase-like lactoylglutathione lyase family enzyme
MELHLGRLLDHVHIRVADLEKSKAFYRAVLKALGRSLVTEDERHFSSDEFYVTAADDGVSRVHLAFQASDEEMVRRFHEAGLAAGGRDNGKPGERSYHPGYFAAFILDPDGINLEAVFHGPADRSADSVVITADDFK